MPQVTIDRELLERLACEVMPTTHQELLDASDDFGAAIKELRAILAAPRQPVGSGFHDGAKFASNVMRSYSPQPSAVPAASRLDADDVRAACQNAIEVFADEENAEQCREVAEYMREVLLADLERAALHQPPDLRQLAAEFDAAPDDAKWEPPHPIFLMAQERDKLRADLESERELARDFQQEHYELQAERDTLRQQLAEMTKDRDDCLSARKHYVEKVGDVLAQNYTLAGLLAKAQEELDPHRHAVLWGEICTALAEVK